MTSTLSQNSKGRNIALQCLRGVAASAVVVYHAAYFTAAHLNAPWLVSIFNGNFGYYGVLVFFVLSGFLMESAVRRYRAGKFLLHRFMRLFPTFWILLLCLYVVQGVRVHGVHELGSIPWGALSLLPLGEMVRPLGVEWTLVYEVFFYVVCALLCFRRSLYLWVMLIWLAIVVDAVFAHGQFGSVYQPTLWEIPFSIWNVGFICGGLAGVLNRSLRLPSPELLCLLGISLFLLGFNASVANRIFFGGPGIALIVIALVRWQPAEPRAPGLFMRSLFLLGEYSYGMYLAHVMSIQIVLQYVSVSSDPLHTYAAMLGVGLAAGIAAGMLDVALYRRLKGWVDKRIRSAPRLKKKPAEAPA